MAAPSFWRIFWLAVPACARSSCAPGNAGTAFIGPTVTIDMTDVEEIAAWATAAKIELVISGEPEALTAGLTDACVAQGLRALGPTAASATRLDDEHWVAERLRERGVTTMSSVAAAEADTVLAFLALADGRTVCSLGLALVYRHMDDRGHGPLTEGMGACVPPPGVPSSVGAWLESAVAQPLVALLAEAGTPYQGFLYVEAVVDPSERGTPRILSVRPGLHPMATQALLPLLKTDLLLPIIDATEGTLANSEIVWNDGGVCAVTLISQGYPDVMAYETGYGIVGSGEVPRNVLLVHEATRNPYAPRDAVVIPSAKESEPRSRVGGGIISSMFGFGRRRKEATDAQAKRGSSDPFSRLVTGGGRVLTAVAVAPTIDMARQRAYAAAGMISYTGRAYREDIGKV